MQKSKNIQKLLSVVFLCVSIGGIYDKNSYTLPSTQWAIPQAEASGVDQDESFGSADQGEACAESERVIEIPLIQYV